MVSDLTFIPALNGEEIITDICGITADKLRTDCNLRPIDGYAGGYKATVTVHIEAYGLDAATVDYTVEIDETGPGHGVQSPVDLTNPDTLIDIEFEVPVEPDLSLVRERSQQTAPDFEMKPQPEITPEGPVVREPRKYSKRLKALGLGGTPAVAQGGATGPVDE